MKKYKMAIMGSREIILGFKALGLDTFYVKDPAEALERLTEIKKEKMEVERESLNKYAIVFVMEELIREISAEDYKKLTEDPLPALIPLPSHLGSTGFGLTKLKRIVEKGVGMNILN